MKGTSHINATLRSRQFDETEPVTVSICTITFNHVAFIAEALESFLNQRAPFKVEIIVYDDASTDGTAEILKSYADKYPTIIKHMLSDRNVYSLGVNPYYAVVFPAAKGEFIAICDGDDYWTDPEKLVKQVRVLRADSGVAITYGRVFADLGAGKIARFPAGLERNTTSLELKSSPALNTPTVCFRNPFLRCPPPFLRNSPIGDQTVWAIVGAMGRGHFLEELEPCGYRIHSGGIFSMRSRRQRYYMSLIANTCIAAYHDDNGDEAAEHQLLNHLVSALNTRLGFWRIVFIALKNSVGRSRV